MKTERIGVKEIASILGCCEQTVRRHHARGLIPTQQIGGKNAAITSTRSELSRFMKRMTRVRRDK